MSAPISIRTAQERAPLLQAGQPGPQIEPRRCRFNLHGRGVFVVFDL